MIKWVFKYLQDTESIRIIYKEFSYTLLNEIKLLELQKYFNSD